MTDLLYGRPPAVFDPPGAATQTSPLIPGATALESFELGSIDSAMVYAPPGVLERRYTLALALRALKPGGRLTAMALKDKGGSRLKKELEAFGASVAEDAKAHHRRCVVIKGENLTGLDEAVAAGALRQEGGVWTQPGVFAWDRVDPGSALLIQNLPPLTGAGADLGGGLGLLAQAALRSPKVTAIRVIESDRRAVEAARLNLTDPRASVEWADVRDLTEAGDLQFVIMNPPFHSAGAEDRRLGAAFIQKAAGLLRRGGSLWMVANRHLPYEAELAAAFRQVKPIDAAGYKLFEAIK
ncbi:methyltransferase [Brevundimonas sp. Leaf363]|uniref:class I SAM-dependent methyltransferase n=1 Tax=Brevundimonas sp. Leaf363 TaxID=1736353 RepID=UPI0006FE017B|nr:methyltransferase [Brevundimonas sp. Leaf363]KQS57187.1 methyltransferase [Brevundimonas sp. Leaf363]